MYTLEVADFDHLGRVLQDNHGRLSRTVFPILILFLRENPWWTGHAPLPRLLRYPKRHNKKKVQVWNTI
ncbi:MAG: hypothetical protein ACI8RN_000539 [Glaciecola sp.]|jgi:hypothetical protein